MSDTNLPEQIRIFSDGTGMALDLHLPTTRGPHPVVILCHGYGGWKGLLFGEFATMLNDRGWAAVAFDYRGFGESDGPRGRLLPQEQVADIGAVVTWCTTREDLAYDRIAAVGISLGGANAIAAAAGDDRIGAVASLMGVADGERWMRDLRRYSEWLAFLDRLAADRVDRVLTGRSQEVDPNEILIRDAAALARDDSLRERFAERREFRMSLASADALLRFKPLEVVHRIGPRPSYFVGCSEDTVTPVDHTLALYARARQPKDLVLLDGLSHWDLYQPAHISGVLDGMLGFFQATLPAGGVGPGDVQTDR